MAAVIYLNCSKCGKRFSESGSRKRPRKRCWHCRAIKAERDAAKERQRMNAEMWRQRARTRAKQRGVE